MPTLVTAIAVGPALAVGALGPAAGVPSIVGLEPYHLIRPFVRPASFPYARFDIAGVDHIPRRGPVLLAANHRSYFDVAALAIVAPRSAARCASWARRRCSTRRWSGRIARAIGGIPVDRAAVRGQPLRAAEAALRGGRGGHGAAPGHHPPG